MVDYRKYLEAAKQKALAWTPDAEHVDPGRMTWQSAAACIIGIFTDAMHAAECEGCAVKGVNHYMANMAVKWTANDPDNVPAYKAAIAAQQMHEMYQKGVDLGLITGPPPDSKGVGWDDYPHDNLPFHNVFEVDHNPGAQMLRDLQAQLQAQNELLTLLQSQRDAYKTRLDALMTDGLLVDKTKYRLEFADETEGEVRLRLVEIV